MSTSALQRFRYMLALGMLAALFAPLASQAQTLNISYYTIASNDPDANHLAGGVYTNEVENALGPNGLPVLNIPQYGCSSNCYNVNGAPGFPGGGTTPNANVQSVTGEITYWDPFFNPYVTNTLNTTTTLPFNEPGNFFPPNGTGSSGDGGNAGYQAAVISGLIDLPTAETVGFNIGSDDMAFAYIDDQLVCSDGGVHASSSVPCTTPSVLSAGNHVLDLFFVDINQSQSGLTFDITTSGVTTSPTGPTAPAGAPEIDAGSAPAALILLLGAIAVMRGRRPVHRLAA
jgi:hypothetical protein